MMLLVIFCAAFVNAQFYDLNDGERYDFNEHYNFYKLDNQWKPMGRSDPLKNDPTFDYLPPVLKKVNYWIDPSLRKSDISEILTKNNNEAASLTSSRTNENAAIRSEFAPTSSFFFSPSRTHLKNFNYRPSVKLSNLQFSQSPIKTIRNHEINSLLNFFIEKNFERKPSASANHYTFKTNNYNNAVKPSITGLSRAESSSSTTTSRPISFSIIEGHSKVKKYGSSTSTASDLNSQLSKNRNGNNREFYSEKIKKRDVQLFQEAEFVAKYNVSKEQTTEKYTKGIVI